MRKVDDGEEKRENSDVYSGHQSRCQSTARTPTDWNATHSCQNTTKQNMSSAMCNSSIYSRLCMKMMFFLFVLAWAMPRILYLSCGIPPLVWTPGIISGLTKIPGKFLIGREGGKKKILGEGQVFRSSSFFRQPSFLMSSSFLRCSLLFWTPPFLRLSSILRSSSYLRLSSFLGCLHFCVCLHF